MPHKNTNTNVAFSGADSQLKYDYLMILYQGKITIFLFFCYCHVYRVKDER